jgi:RsiW-degrading membrane proteinase PrsW (M82 family)
MLQEIIQFFVSAFHFPGLSWTLILAAISIGLFFGAIWLSLYRPPLLKRPGLLIVFIISAFLTWASIAFVQIPLQIWTGQVLYHFWDQATIMQWLLLMSIPQILLSGLVQEAAKLIPIIVYWLRSGRNFTPKFGLITGAVAGAGFGVFEAVWVLNSIFASGWTWQTVEVNGILALSGFWERLFAVAFHIAASALAGYGLAKRRGWQFYLLAAFLHGVLNYSIILMQTGLFTAVQLEIYIAVISVAVTAAALWLRWRKDKSLNQDT